nr:DNA-formamidopyrimidine glycosylase family protein [Saccharopolyspora sp. HNM0983]
MPDVEGFRRVAEGAAGRIVRSVAVRDAQVVRNAEASGFDAALRGRRLGHPRRHGKLLLLPTGSGRGFPAVLLHFGMTGMLLRTDAGDPPHPHDRVVVSLDRGELRYRDQRKLIGIALLTEQGGWQAELSRLGPDAAAIDRDELRDRLGRTRRQLKAALLDQTRVAGLGNLTVDEVLWRARLHPRTATTDLRAPDWRRLDQRLHGVVAASARAGCVPPRPSWLTGHRDERAGRCPRCATELTSGVLSGRTTVWCPSCQRA